MKPDGGPAFPEPYTGNEYTKGMSLRDYFAAKAMTGCMQMATVALATAASAGIADLETHTKALLNLEHLSKDAYQIADAMIAERSKP